MTCTTTMLSQSPNPRDLDDELLAECATYYADPLGFVVGMYRWPIHGEPGPDTWQADVLRDVGDQVTARGFDGVTPVLPIRIAISSGHGIGKGALVSWLVDWLMSTRRNAQGTITATTNDQLANKTWAAIRYWTGLCLTSHWFEINSAIMYRKGFRASWFCAPQSCAEENSEAFAGQHKKDSTSFYVFDEGSGIGSQVWQVAEGGLTDGEPFLIVTGNATRNEGEFHRICHGSGRDLWRPRIIDSRDCKLPNKALIAQWLEEYGEDSDFFRVRVRGLPPRASSLQFIGQDLVWQAQKRPDPLVLPDEPLIAGVDLSGGGNAWNVVRFRRGYDARTIPPLRVSGEATRNDRSAFLAVLAGVLRDRSADRRVTMMFCDSAYGAPYVERLQAMGFKNVQEVNSGATTTPDRVTGKVVLETKTENMRAYMWAKGKEWLRLGGALPAKDTKLEADLVAPGYHLNKSDRLVLESKESMHQRDVGPTDDADALFFTFAAPVVQGWKSKVAQERLGRFQGRRGGQGGPSGLGWMS